jgi:ATP-dependent RNA helicase RhlE
VQSHQSHSGEKVTFQSLGLPEPILKSVRAVGYKEPTPIQVRAIPMILPGGDLVAAAQTGSGKTAAFVLPILARLLEGPQALRALILVPTRELAAQVESAAKQYARYARVRVGSVYGGVSIIPQERMLRSEGVELLVATPGRLLDLHGRHSVALDEVEVLVLDEADRMVDMGFAPDLRRILALLPRDRQTLMFSATMPPELNRVAGEALHKPQRLDLAPPSRPAETIEQAIYQVPRHLKVDLLHELLGLHDDRLGTIVFTRTKRGADRLARQLKTRGHDVAVLHGDRTQGQRERALQDFRRNRVEILVATDIASRGIDVDDVTHVVNYDVPKAPEDYVHRIGRTGRMNAEGEAITLVSPEERKEIEAIEKFMGRTVRRLKLEDFDYHRSAPPRVHGESHGDDGRGRRGGRPARGSYSGRDSGARSHGRSGSHDAPRSRGRSNEAPPSSRPSTGHATPGHTPAPTHGRRIQRNPGDRRSRKRM